MGFPYWYLSVTDENYPWVLVILRNILCLEATPVWIDFLSMSLSDNFYKRVILRKNVCWVHLTLIFFRVENKVTVNNDEGIRLIFSFVFIWFIVYKYRLGKSIHSTPAQSVHFNRPWPLVYLHTPSCSKEIMQRNAIADVACLLISYYLHENILNYFSNEFKQS